MTTSQVLVVFLSSSLSALLGYVFGVSRDRGSERYKRRVEAATELRTKIMQAVRRFPFITNDVRVFAGGSIAPASLQKLDEYLRIVQDQSEDFRRDLATAFGYYHASKPWLSIELREAFEALANSVNHRSVLLSSEVEHQLRLTDERQKEKCRERLAEQANELDGWVRTDLSALRDTFEVEVERAIGNPPLWRRILFGQ